MFPSILRPLKEERVQEDPDATVSNGLMVRQLGVETVVDDLLPRTQMCHIWQGWDPIKLEGHNLHNTRSVGFGQVYLRSNDFGVCGLWFFGWLSLSTIETLKK